MTRIAIVGGHGQIAQKLGTLLLDAGHTPVALVRKNEQIDELVGKGFTARLLDIEADESDSFALAFEGCEAVVFAAGGGGDGSVERKRSVDLGGSLKAIDGAKRAGISRFVQVSVIGADEPVEEDAGEVWQAYMSAKRDADTALRESGLDYTIIRPGALTDDAGGGKVEVGPETKRSEVSRDDVAAVLAAVWDDDRTVGKQWNVVAGDHSVADAIDAALS